MNTRKHENSLAELSGAPGAQHLACALCGSRDAQPVIAKKVNGHGAALARLLHPWEWMSTRVGGGSSLQVCAERLSQEAAGSAS